MKGSLKLRPRRALTRSEAWACFSANLAMPGSGSLAAGRAVGYAQMAAVFLAMIFTFVTAIPLVKWTLASGGVPQSATGDPFEAMGELWIHVRWPLFCIGIYVASTLWSLMTSMSILAEAPKDGVPPKIR